MLKEFSNTNIKSFFNNTNDKRQIDIKEIEFNIKESIIATNESKNTKIFTNHLTNLISLCEKYNSYATYKKNIFQLLQMIVPLLVEYKFPNEGLILFLISNIFSCLKGITCPKFLVEINILFEKILKTYSLIIVSLFTNIIEMFFNLVNTEQNNESINLILIIDETLKDFVNFMNKNDQNNGIDEEKFYKCVENGLKLNSPNVKINIISWLIFADSNLKTKLINQFYKFVPYIFPMLCENKKEIIYTSELIIKNMFMEYKLRFSEIKVDVHKNLMKAIIDQSGNNDSKCIYEASELIEIFVIKTFEIIYNNNSYDQFNDLLFELIPLILDSILKNIKSNSDNLALKCITINSLLLNLFEFLNAEKCINLPHIFIILKDNLEKYNDYSLEYIMCWINKITSTYHREFIENLSTFMNFTTLQNEVIFNHTLDFLTKLSTFNEEYLKIIIREIFIIISCMKQFYISKIQTIIRKFITCVGVKKTYINAAYNIHYIKSLRIDKEKEFMSLIITSFNIFLLLSEETDELKLILEKDLETFEIIYSAWCYNPISCLILCMISYKFDLSYELILKL